MGKVPSDYTRKIRAGLYSLPLKGHNIASIFWNNWGGVGGGRGGYSEYFRAEDELESDVPELAVSKYNSFFSFSFLFFFSLLTLCPFERTDEKLVASLGGDFNLSPPRS
jgi:hypothetical protein